MVTSIKFEFSKTEFKSDMIGFRTTMEDADCCEPSLPAPLEGKLLSDSGRPSEGNFQALI